MITPTGRTHPRAFTLVELLVVIAVIALLAAMLLPLLTMARERARASVCQSNEHQIGLAFGLYLDDWDHGYPPPADADNYTPFWRERRLPYLSDIGVFRCPDNQLSEPFAYPTHWTDGELAQLKAPLGYAMNGVAFGSEASWQATGGIYAGRPASDFRDPAGTLLVGDTRFNWPIVLPQFAAPALVPMTQEEKEMLGISANEHLILAHLGLVNWLFCDGHTRSLKVGQTLLPLNLWRAASHDPNVADGNVQFLLPGQMAPEYR